MIFSNAAAAINNHACLRSPVYTKVPGVQVDPPDGSRDAAAAPPSSAMLPEAPESAI